MALQCWAFTGALHRGKLTSQLLEAMVTNDWCIRTAPTPSICRPWWQANQSITYPLHSQAVMTGQSIDHLPPPFTGRDDRPINRSPTPSIAGRDDRPINRSPTPAIRRPWWQANQSITYPLHLQAAMTGQSINHLPPPFAGRDDRPINRSPTPSIRKPWW